MADCQSLQNLANNNGLLTNSNYSSNGTVIWLACKHADHQIYGHSQLTCNNGTWSSDLPKCSDNHLTKREIIIIAACSGVLFIVLVLMIFLIIRARQRKLSRRSRRIQEKLQTFSSRDPLEEIVRRETMKKELNISYRPTALVTLPTRTERHLFKIWNQNRTKKIFTYAASITELLTIASTRMNLTNPNKLVLEEDGTEVTSDEILESCAGAVLLVLEPGQEWFPSFKIDVNQLRSSFVNRSNSVILNGLGLYSTIGSSNDEYIHGNGNVNKGFDNVGEKVGQ